MLINKQRHEVKNSQLQGPLVNPGGTVADQETLVCSCQFHPPACQLAQTFNLSGTIYLIVKQEDILNDFHLLSLFFYPEL